VKYLLHIPFYVAFVAFVGYFSSAPPYRHLEPGEAVVKLSLSHAGELKQPCRQRSQEELARLAPNMRAQLDCPRERSDVRVVLEMDGQPLASVAARPSGLRNDLPSTIYRRFEVPGGRHTFRARLADTPGGELRHQGEVTLDLPPGGVLVVDFVASRGGFLFSHGGGSP
jgi:hypothetical protein